MGKVSTEKRLRIVQLRAKSPGLSIGAIALRFGISEDVVRKIIREGAGPKPATKGEQ